MRVLLVDAFPPGHPTGPALVEAAIATLQHRGHDVQHEALVATGFRTAMSAEERDAYHGDTPLRADDTRHAAAEVARADALLFCYPTVTGTVPAVLKGWLERVLVPGVAFGFDETGRVTRGLTHVHRLGVVTTGEGRIARLRGRDGGRRTILQTLRIQCANTCRRSWVCADDPARVRRTLSRW